MATGGYQMLKWSCFCVAIVSVAQLLPATVRNANGQSSVAPAGQTPVRQIRRSDLVKTPFQAGPLTITIVDFKTSQLLGTGVASVGLTVENTSSSFATFSPSQLCFVSKDGTLVDVFGAVMANWPNSAPPTPTDRNMPPATHTRTDYYLSETIDLPARLYYQQKLIAEITK
jgi:hypothetical protein